MTRLGAATTVLWALALGLGSALASPKPVDLRDWIAGPAHYLADAQEVRAFREQKTDTDRSRFIERFWALRDQTPETLANEMRQIFWERVSEANRMFLDSHKPGWATDRGKIYILYGPPSRIEDHPDLQADGAANGRGVLRWIYEGRPGQRIDLNPIVVVPFVREVSGEYRLSYDPKLASVFFNELALREKWGAGRDKFLEMMSAPRPTELSVMLDLGRMQEVPPQSRALLERVETLESYSTRPVKARLSSYVHPDRPGVLVLLTADVSDIAAGVQPVAIARFSAHDATHEQRMLGEDSFRITAAAGRRMIQGRIVLDPGVYDLTLMIADPSTAATGMYRRTFVAKASAAELRMSDVVLALELTPVEYAALASHDEPYHVGPFRIVPRIEDSVPRGEPVRVFYELYGGKAPFQIEYQVEGHEVDGRWITLGRPSAEQQEGRAQGWELPTSDAWPAGEYRVRIGIKDAAGGSIETSLPFRLEPKTAAP